MSKITDQQRIKQLENKAKKLFIENSNWKDVIAMLDEDERDEYGILMGW